MRTVIFILCCAVLMLLMCASAQAHWVTKNGFKDYAQHMVGVPPVEQLDDGMPDFDQKQDHWYNGQLQWVWCGPVAAGNCLWWFDSKMENIKAKSLPPGAHQRPPAISDHYALVHALTGLDDHDVSNAIPFITLLGTQPPGVGMQGITAQQMKTMIENYLALPQVNLYGHYTIRIIGSPTFEQIYAEVAASQDVILLLGFWQMQPSGAWLRFGGHWLTVAGVDSQENQQWISLSDPMWDAAESGRPGVVWNGWLLPHMPLHGPAIHNDAGNVSHDWYRIQVSGSPGGGISPEDYGIDWEYETWQNFQGLNVPDHLQMYQGAYDPTLPVHCEEEGIVVICPNFDYGDLGMDYPTIDIESCGPAHPLSDKAWLGEGIDAELQPRIYNQDNLFDDGVQFIGLPWSPNTMVSVNVTVTTGAHYAGEALYLNAWKDANVDGDFDDGPASNENNWMSCSEWTIQDVPVGAGTMTHTFCDPMYALGDYGPIDLIMRFRLTSQPIGRFGYGGYWGGGFSNGWGTYDIDWVLGEVEDYDSTDMQLAVELSSMEAIAADGAINLEWLTASEYGNDYFRVERSPGSTDWIEIARVHSAGNSTTPQHYRYHDEPLANGRLFSYRLSAVDWFGTVEVLGVRSAIPSAEVLPLDYVLKQNYPNPFNAATEIRYSLPEAGLVSLTLYNANGQLVRTLVHETQVADHYAVTLDARDLASGIYWYELSVNEFTAVKKMVLLK